MEAMESEQFFLKWNNFENNLTSGFADLLQQEAMVDVTLAAEGKIIQAHKIILSICSSYFRNMFQLNPCQHPIVVLKDVGYNELVNMLDFMYKGEANVRQEDLPSFLKLAETLKVKGLAGSPSDSESSNIKKDSESQLQIANKYGSSDENEECLGNAVGEDIALKKKRKRPTSPHKNLSVKSLPYSQNIKLEVEKYNDNFIEEYDVKIEDAAPIKDERLSENNLYSYKYNNMRTEKDLNPGPSDLDCTLESIPQEFKFRFNPKRVPIWDFYTVNYEYEMAVCKVCRKIIKTRRKDGTRNVLSHMRNLHPEQYALALQYKEQWISMKRKRAFHLITQ